ncbi:DNA-formamidopyrimidine glycosylase family protein [Streptomyces sp. NPDC005435]|uniref:DNA-formamidopyrimidine glycosylase family protein n=1 Tax=Streptomyces sp. NPDC005435 TaxID=3154464 RepID=UPI003454FEC3
MPELRDVECFRGVLERCGQGRRVREVDAGVLREVSAERLQRAVAGRAFAEPRRHGKFLVAPLDDGSGDDGPARPSPRPPSTRHPAPSPTPPRPSRPASPPPRTFRPRPPGEPQVKPIRPGRPRPPGQGRRMLVDHVR